MDTNPVRPLSFPPAHDYVGSLERCALRYNFGDCSPGEESHRLILQALSNCAAFSIRASRSGPGFSFCACSIALQASTLKRCSNEGCDLELKTRFLKARFQFGFRSHGLISLRHWRRERTLTAFPEQPRPALVPRPQRWKPGDVLDPGGFASSRSGCRR